jgi:hypothetical protein
VKIPVRTAALANLAHWRAGQGARIQANRVPEVYRACEFMARQWASIRDPLILEPAELATAVKRAISQERNKRHENQPLRGMTADEFWTQISEIAAQWNIPTSREQWESKSSERREAA